MLSTSSSQYLQPEYIQPLPSSLDVNSSPLALLAQTCSSIGKDSAPPPSKAGGGGGGGTGSASSDKKAPHANGCKDSRDGGGSRSKSESPPIGRNVSLCPEERSKSRTSGNDRKDSGHGQRCASKGTTPKPGFRVPPTPSKEGSASSSLRADRVNVDSACETGGRSSRENPLHPPLPSTVVGGRPVVGGHGTLVGNAVSVKSAGGTGNNCSSMLLELNQEALNKSSLHGPLHPLYGSFKDGIQALHGSLAPSSLGALPFLGYPLSLDPLAAAAAYSASLAAHCSGLAAAAAAAGLGLTTQKSPSTTGMISSTPCSAAASALPPYASYVRMKTAVGGTTLVPVCKDPYCAHCQVALHSAAQLAASAGGGGAGTSCTAGPGCGQCTAHGKSSPTGLASPTHHTGLSFFPPPPGASSALCSHAAFSAASPAALQGTSPHHHGGPLVTPYVCNWVQGSEGYCGKRFSSSDDLLQHLRSHTSTAASDALVSPFHPLSAAAAAAIGFPFGGLLGCPALSPGGLLSAPSSSYQRSLSPNSLLSAARYHPYKPPSLSVLSGGTPPGLSGAFPSLAAYYSPYAFYGQRVGAAAAVGP